MLAHLKTFYYLLVCGITIVLVGSFLLGYYLQRGAFQFLIGASYNHVQAETSFLSNKTLQEDSNKTLYLTNVKIEYARLGNQMFIYASLLGLARAQGRELIFTPGWDVEYVFLLHHVAQHNTTGWLRISEANALAFDSKLTSLPKKDLIIYGYLQSFKYFMNIADEVRHEFIFHDSIAKDASLILHDVYTKYKGSLVVGVHVRRGDFLTKRNTNLGYRAAEKTFYIKAFELLKSKFSGRNLTFIVASDDLSWCSTNLVGGNVITIPPASPAVHMATLARCDHVIISGGTYSWWVGWLSCGVVIYFTENMPKNTTFGKFFEQQDLYPKFWIGLGN